MPRVRDEHVGDAVVLDPEDLRARVGAQPAPDAGVTIDDRSHEKPPPLTRRVPVEHEHGSRVPATSARRVRYRVSVPESSGEEPRVTTTDEGQLPPHTVRVSARAKRARLVMSPRDGLVVVVPRERDRARVGHLLREHADWVRRAGDRVAERRAHLDAAAGPLPAEVRLAAVGERLEVRTRAVEAGRPARAVERGGAIVLDVPGGDEAAARAALRRWLTRAARERLVPLLAALSNEHALPYARATVRAQRARWGSCSRTGSISLNRALLFLDPPLVRCVLVHELVHTKRHDHSPAFWAALRARVPDADALGVRLRDAWRDVPPWAEER